MVIEIDERSGFCFGVVGAISKAEESLAGGNQVYTLGDIVHNRMEMERLEELGLRRATQDRLDALRGCSVLIRAHGAPPALFAKAQAAGVRLIDATCPVVARLQKLVREAWSIMEPLGGQVVILGKKGHAEVVGLTGQIDDKAIVIESTDDLYNDVDPCRPIYMISQTTKSPELFDRVSSAIYDMVPGGRDNAGVIIKDTICRQVSSRYEHLKEFAARFDAVLFVSGAESSNGNALYHVCLSVNTRTYKIESPEAIEPQWLAGMSSVGICGATSTPKWLMERVADTVRKMAEKR
ncbi:MAG: 4-hydroxy-3-methylbut-2-enyl diphosphate reductase [Rikenellaceae bacterium]|nr:4-hydroxy-3-methylbut-2-enyl diphosphate reductase [Rikenellaceae bacterium]